MNAQETKPTPDVTIELKNRSCNYCAAVVRILMGLGWCIFGLNGFFHFIPEPKTPMPQGAADFAGALFKTGYMFQLICGTQLLAGILLLTNRFVPLALVILMPLIVNILAFHFFLAPAPGALAPGIVFTVMVLYLAWVYRAAYRSLLTPRAVPNNRLTNYRN